MRPKIPDQQFHHDLRQSHNIAVLVAAWLTTKGIEAEVNTMRVTPSHGRRHDFTDDGDIMTPEGRIEVKHWPKIAFTCEDDMPYPWIFVDEVYQLEREHSQPLRGYVICNAEVTHAAMIGADTADHWRKIKKNDSRYGVELEWYACPRRLVKFAQIGERDG